MPKQEKIRNVYVVMTGDYADYGIVGVYGNFESAAELIKSRFSHPYIVRWELEGNTLIGNFDAVSGYSIKHIAKYDIISFEVEYAN